jgi:hypothetical protein
VKTGIVKAFITLGVFTASSMTTSAGAQEQPSSQPAPDAAVAAATPAPAPKPAAPAAPPYTVVRWNENYGYMKDFAKGADPFDAIKYIPLNDAGDVFLSLGGQARYRYEWFDNFNFGAPGQQDGDGFHLLRLMYHADLQIGPNFRAFVQMIDAFADDRDPSERAGIDENDFDFHQAFGDLKLPVGDDGAVTLRAGRQNLIYGAQRLISPLEWTNTRRTFDGGKASFAFPGGRNTLDVFYVHPVIVNEPRLDSFTDDQAFAGAYDTLALPDLIKGAGSKVEMYLLYLDKFAATFAEGTGTEERWTAGARLSATPKPFDFDVEGAIQFGEFAGGDIFAYMLAAEAGYTLVETPLTPRLYLGFDIASGDDDPDDGDLETFNQLFPLGHAFFGYVDVVGRQNIIDLHPGIELTLLENQSYFKKLTLRTDYHLFWRQSTDDALYGVQGQIQRADGGSDESFVGSEIDLLLNWQIDRHISAYLGYSHFFAGDFIEDTGPSEDTDFFYAAALFTF